MPGRGARSYNSTAIGDDEPDPHRGAPRKASRSELVGRLNRLAVALNYAHEELSEIRHDLGVADRLEVVRRNVEVL